VADRRPPHALRPQSLPVSPGHRLTLFLPSSSFDNCLDGSDEPDCPSGSSGQCQIEDKLADLVFCDGHKECNDGSDEANCPMFEYAKGDLISASRVCNLDPDCNDKSTMRSGTSHLVALSEA
jgi:hypothetical protein